jgi:hypothetical protein
LLSKKLVVKDISCRLFQHNRPKAHGRSIFLPNPLWKHKLATAAKLSSQAHKEKLLTNHDGGAEEDRTPDLRIANATLSQLSYRPIAFDFIDLRILMQERFGLGRLESCLEKTSTSV